MTRILRYIADLLNVSIRRIRPLFRTTFHINRGCLSNHTAFRF